MLGPKPKKMVGVFFPGKFNAYIIFNQGCTKDVLKKIILQIMCTEARVMRVIKPEGKRIPAGIRIAVYLSALPQLHCRRHTSHPFHFSSSLTPPRQNPPNLTRRHRSPRRSAGTSAVRQVSPECRSAPSLPPSLLPPRLLPPPSPVAATRLGGRGRFCGAPLFRALVDPFVASTCARRDRI